MRAPIPLALVLLVAPSIGSAQNHGDFRWEKALAAGQVVRIQNVNGDITVTPSSSGRVEIVGVHRGSSRYADDITAEVHETSTGIIVCVVWKDSDDDCNEDGYRSHGHDDGDRWNRGSMDLEVKLPRDLQVSAGSVSGNVSVVGAQGNVRASSVSGDVRLERLRATSLKATTVSGEVTASIEALDGNGPLTVTSVSGDVTLELPRNLDADLSMSSVSGHLDSEFQLTIGGRTSRRRLEAKIGRGGRDLDVKTVSGDVRLRTAK